MADFDLNKALASLNFFNKEGNKEKIKPDLNALANQALNFKDSYLEDFAKKEQDNYDKQTVRNQSDENDRILGTTIGAVAGMAICTAVGAPNPICGVIGGAIGGFVQGLLTKKLVDISPTAIKLMKILQLDENANDKRRNASRMAYVLDAYGFDRVLGIIDIVNCIKSKGITYNNYQLIHWVPYSLLSQDPKRYNEGLYYAILYNDESDDFFNDVTRDDATPNWFSDTMNAISEIEKKDKRCFEGDLTGKTALGYSLVKMWQENIRTPAAVRKFSSYYDDGQKEQHKQMADPCSEFYDIKAKIAFEEKNGKCPTKKTNNKGNIELVEILQIVAIGLGVGIVYKASTK